MNAQIPSLLSRLSTKSPWLYRINAGSCNGCDVELATTAIIPRYDVERLGCQYCGSPKHADIVLITGPLTVRVKDKVLRLYQEIPDPKVTVAVGVCPISGGVFRDSYAIAGPLDQYIPIDVNVPGCPPRPQAIIEGIAKAIAVWQTRI
ncbi:NADH-quinone oxidoreductase subunit B family protein [Telmatospirillum siberiense]|uniref:NADH-quinone oxidoreductase subunit B n=1 Tax=Telmatospirillum siberiense TaxID=382514 RepID=A0A2N3PX11_9PROT|nr:NADH-quinone oxidoreductase subunit NuoB [Telmatospirillum siberiense]PKU24928.1 NADH-quinone oxidoreductase subunit B [Telmatospirillum siberiense]